MKLLNRLNLVLLTCLGTAYVGAGLYFYKQADQQYLTELQEASERQMQIAQAIRMYTTDHVRKALLKDQNEFHPASVPSFSANQTMHYLQAVYPGQIYREVALNPTNPANLAKGWEVQAIEHFRSSSDSMLTKMTTDKNGEPLLNYAKPIKVSSASCLVCHSTPDAAPKTLIAKYGSEHGFGWQLNEVVAAQVVTVPAAVAKKKRNASLMNYLVSSLTVMVCGFVALNWALRQAVVRPIQSAEKTWRKLASEDPLTGAANRRSLLTVFDLMVSEPISNHPVSVIFADIDHFKRVNDGPGHQAGDEVLREVTRRIQTTIRRADMLGRYGGEEFAIVLPSTTEAEALILANKLKAVIAEKPFTAVDLGGKEITLEITASFGVAQVGETEDSAGALARADKALYAAKNGGRNMAISASAVNGGPRS
jgi:two-component system cell cycle response regulator